MKFLVFPLVFHWKTLIERTNLQLILPRLQLPLLGGGFLSIFYFHPKNWGNDPIWPAYFSNGWFNHQLVVVL